MLVAEERRFPAHPVPSLAIAGVDGYPEPAVVASAACATAPAERKWSIADPMNSALRCFLADPDGYHRVFWKTFSQNLGASDSPEERRPLPSVTAAADERMAMPARDCLPPPRNDPTKRAFPDRGNAGRSPPCS